MPILLAPSILAADFSNLERTVREIEAGGADLVHVDVMDGHFVPNLTMGPFVVSCLKRITRLPLDVHLMVTNPEELLDAFLSAGSDGLSFHLEAVLDPAPLLARIRGAGRKAGLAIRPATPVETLRPFARSADLVVVMTVNPGFAGQSLIPETIPKIAAARALLPPGTAVEADGGVNPKTAPEVVRAGAEVLVAGASVFGQGDPASALRALRRAAEGPAIAAGQPRP